MKEEKDYGEMRENLIVGAQIGILPLLVLLAIFSNTIIGSFLKFTLLFFIAFVIIRIIDLTILDRLAYKRWLVKQKKIIK